MPTPPAVPTNLPASGLPNSTPVANAAPESAPSLPEDVNWRIAFNDERRVPVIQYILSKLIQLCPSIPQDFLRDRARFYEAAQYAQASTKSTYLKVIADNIERLARASVIAHAKQLSRQSTATALLAPHGTANFAQGYTSPVPQTAHPSQTPMQSSLQQPHASANTISQPFLNQTLFATPRDPTVPVLQSTVLPNANNNLSVPTSNLAQHPSTFAISNRQTVGVTKPPVPRKRAVRPRKRQTTTKPSRQQPPAVMRQYNSHMQPTLQSVSTPVMQKSAPTLAPSFPTDVPQFTDPNAAMSAHYRTSPIQYAQMSGQQGQMRNIEHFPSIQEQTLASLAQNQQRDHATFLQQERRAHQAPGNVQISATNTLPFGMQHHFAQVSRVPARGGLAAGVVNGSVQEIDSGPVRGNAYPNMNQSPHGNVHAVHQAQFEKPPQLTLTEEQMRSLDSEQIRRILIIANERNLQNGQGVSPVLAHQTRRPATLHGQEKQVSTQGLTDATFKRPISRVQGLQYTTQASDLNTRKRPSNATQSQLGAQVVSPALPKVRDTQQEMNITSYGQKGQAFAVPSMLPSIPTAQCQVQHSRKSMPIFQGQRPSDGRDATQPGQSTNLSQDNAVLLKEGNVDVHRRDRVPSSIVSPQEKTVVQTSSQNVYSESERLRHSTVDPRSQVNPGILVNPNDYRTATRLVQIQKRYRPALRKFMPVIRRMIEKYPFRERNRFSEHLRKCCGILSTSFKVSRKGKIEYSTPNNPTLSMLARTDAFLLQLMRTTAKVLRYRQNKGPKPNSAKKYLDCVSKPTPVSAKLRQDPTMQALGKPSVETLRGRPSPCVPVNHLSFQKPDFASQKVETSENTRVVSNQVGLHFFTQGQPVSQTQNLQLPYQHKAHTLPHESSTPLQQKMPLQATSGLNPVIANTYLPPTFSQNRTSQIEQMKTPVQCGTLNQHFQSGQKLQEGNEHFQTSRKLQTLRKAEKPLLDGCQTDEGTSKSKKVSVFGLAQTGSAMNAASQEETLKSVPMRIYSSQNATAGDGHATVSAAARSESQCPKTHPVSTTQLRQKARLVVSSVKEALKCTEQWEVLMRKEMERTRTSRIQSTLAVLWRNRDLNREIVESSERGGLNTSLRTDSHDATGVIRSRTSLERSNEETRVEKRPRLAQSEIFRTVEADCQAARERCPSLRTQTSDKYGLPVVSCTLENRLMQLPKLVLHVEQGYPRKGVARYGFEHPAMGWVGALRNIRECFRRTLQSEQTTANGVAAVLVAWADAVHEVVN